MTESSRRKCPCTKRRPICWRTMAAAVVALSTSETRSMWSALIRSATMARDSRMPPRSTLKKKSSGCWRKRSCHADCAARTERGQLPKLPLLILATPRWWWENSSRISESEMEWASLGFLAARWLGSTAPFRWIWLSMEGFGMGLWDCGRVVIV